MMEPFSARVHTRAAYRVNTVHAHNRAGPGVKSLSSNLYDGLNNYSTFSAQFVDELRIGVVPVTFMWDA